jgi:uncharacterized SAM-binding protein YcdF (DUF218 family)
MSVLLKRVVEMFLYPPGNLLFFLILALFFRKKRVLILTIAVLQIVIFSMPIVSNTLLDTLEKQAPPKAELWKTDPLPQAIVVLGGGRNNNAVEYGGETGSMSEIERLRYAALLYRKTDLPILVTGGDPLGEGLSEAELMRHTLEEEFKVPVRWLEDQSHTTMQNAEYSDKILSEAGIQSAWIVTQSWHMPRSLQAFQHRNVQYHSASTSYGSSITWDKLGLAFIPQATALKRSNIAMHEWLGMIWYRLQNIRKAD